MKKGKTNTLVIYLLHNSVSSLRLQTERFAYHSSRMARPRLVASASLTELKASDGKGASTKSGRNFATESSWSLFSNRFVWETFSKGPSFQFSKDNCKHHEKIYVYIYIGRHNYIIRYTQIWSWAGRLRWATRRRH